MNNKNFDVIVVGSGMGGLVCANYLAKTQRKVLVIEKNREPGGYCTSFKRRGFIFDSTIHAIQNCEPNNVLNKIFKQIDINNKISFVRSNPTDTVVSGSHKIHIMNDIKETVFYFEKSFPKHSKSIRSFFKLFTDYDFIYIYSKFKTWTFAELLDYFYFSDELKSIFSMFLGNIGSSAGNTCAISAYALLRQFILSGGYYPIGGMQSIPNALVENLEKNGGVLLLNSEVKEIVIQSDKVCGVRLNNDQVINSNVVISNSDITHTIKKMLTVQSDDRDCLINELNQAEVSYSIYIVYLTLSKQITNTDCGPGLWYVTGMKNLKKDVIDEINLNPGIFCSIGSKLDPSLSPDGCDQIRIMTNARFYDQVFWKKNGKEYSRRLIDTASEVIPNLKEIITCEGRATPITMRNYTLNHHGSVSGWMNSVNQVNHPVTKSLLKIKGLFYVGHWITQRYGNGGIAMAADTGHKIAKSVLKSGLL